MMFLNTEQEQSDANRHNLILNVITFFLLSRAKPLLMIYVQIYKFCKENLFTILTHLKFYFHIGKKILF